MITLAKFAAELGISRQAVYKAATSGMFPTYETDQGRAVDPDDIETAEYAATVRERKSERTAKPVKGRRPSGKKSPTKPAPRRGSGEKKADKSIPVALRNLKGGRKFTGALRQAILDRDGHKCVLCGKTPADGIRLEVDHIKEFEDGGETVYENGQTVCSECNKGKSAAKKLSKADEYISITEFGRRVGVHRNGIAEAIKSGTIEADPVTGKVNYTTEIIKWFQSARSGAPVATGGTGKPSDQIPDYLRDMVDSGNLTPNVALMMPKAWMDKLKIYEQMKTIRQAREEKRRSLVSRTLIKAVFGHIYEIHTTQFLTLKTKIIPDLLSIMSEKRTITADMVGKSVEVFIGNRPETITAADKIIDGESYRVLEAVKREINKALKMIHDKPID